MKTFVGTRVPKLTSYGTLTWESLVRVIDDEKQKTRTLRKEGGREFNWGYRGSSPSALAFAITRNLYGKKKAQACSWVLLETLIQELPSDKNWEIPEEAVHFIMDTVGMNIGKGGRKQRETLRSLIAGIVFNNGGDESNGNSEAI